MPNCCLGLLAHSLFQPRHIRRLSHHDEAIATQDGMRGLWIEQSIAVGALHRQHDYPVLFVNARSSYGSSGEKGALRNRDLFDDHLVFTVASGSEVEKVQNIRPQQ